MSNRLVKNGMRMVAQESVFLKLTVSQAEGVKLESPLPPQEVCKLLQSIAVDVMFNSLVRVEPSKIQVPDTGIVTP